MSDKKAIFIDQPGFYGDIIHLMAIAQDYVNKGHVVYIPVPEQYLEMQKNFPTINFVLRDTFPNYEFYCSHSSIFEDDNFIYLPLKKSPEWNFGGSNRNMEKKYLFLNLPSQMWRNIEITRDYNAENQLFNLLGLKEDDKYNLINEFHQKNDIKVLINVINEFKNIYMCKIEGYNLFDWIKVMQKAQTIHTIGTAIIFLMDVIEAMPNEMHINKRSDRNDHATYDYLLEKKYIYH